MSVLQEQAIKLLGTLPDDRVEIIIQVMQGFLKPVNVVNEEKRIGIAKGKFVVPDDIDV
jgi:sulfopyruvate decarboxylase TPP-binding subunit